MQWEELKGIKEKLVRVDEQLAALHLRGEEIGVQMAALSLKERELDSRLQETRDFSERLSRLVIRVVRGFMQQTQEVSLIKFLLSAILFGAGRDSGPGGSNGPDVPPSGSGSGGPPSPSTSLVSRWLGSAFGSPPTPPSSPGPNTPFSEVSASEGNSFGTAVSSFQEIEAVEATGDRVVLGDRGDSGYDGSSEDSWGGVGDVPHNGAPQFVRVRELQSMVLSREGV